MSERLKNYLLSGWMAVFLAGILLSSLIRTPEEYSMSERRPLAALPKLSAEAVLDGSYAERFDTFSMDQFPFRDRFRRLKALTEFYVFGKKDDHGLYKARGHLSRLEYPFQESMAEYAAQRFDFLYQTYLKDKGIRPYLMIVPDKNAYLAGQSHYLSMDYSRWSVFMKENCPYLEQIEAADLLSLEDYYRTDVHWRQECLPKVAVRIGERLEANVEEDYEKITLDEPFYGVYYGQAALPMKPERLAYLDNDVLESCRATYYEYGEPREGSVYDMEKAAGKDPYEMFLSGAQAIVVLENKLCKNGRHLILFRDSFGSSLAPLLLPGYERITLIDIRYIRSDNLGEYVDFENAEVLFLYSTLLLNNSRALG